ncbi:MAG TPA: transglycosylase SLT domain-containing protein [Pyrinomonadaceae bacterium]|jgi:hypothetical protein
MKLKRTLLLLLAGIISLTASGPAARAQSSPATRLYQEMTQTERASFVGGQARLIARRMSGTDYEFTPAFEGYIQKAVESYAQRLSNKEGDASSKRDARPVFERGRELAPMLMRAFQSRNVSPLIGLYLPLIESEYVNLETPSGMGALGMFQFLPQTGLRFGLTTQELLDAEKSADAAARYIAQNLKRFKADRMKETLALLAYNRGESVVERDLSQLTSEQDRQCSICALTAQREKLDPSFNTENVYYVPRFFAAAIIGENPQAFGLQIQPLSSYQTRP